MNPTHLPPLEARSLKAQCAAMLERCIISGELAIGCSLPPERDFARQLGVSRPVLHEAIVDLAAKGFLVIEPRRGVRVKDFYLEGTLDTFEAIVLHGDGRFAPGVLQDVLGFRLLLEREAVRLAAARGGGPFLAPLQALLQEEAALPALPHGLERRCALDFRFHLLLAEASGNSILPLVMNSIAPIHRSLIERFYRSGPDLALVGGWHGRIIEALQAGEVEQATGLMTELLAHGARTLGGS